MARKRRRTSLGRGRLMWDGRLWDPAGREYQRDDAELTRDEVTALLDAGDIQVAIATCGAGLRWVELADRRSVWRDEIEPNFTSSSRWPPTPDAFGQLPVQAELWRSRDARVLLFTDTC